ncbi:MAG: winged helix-turn-helix transcriptional regulator, partial [Bacteroidetes bacterium]|nr:winged helix-turn-helix transcriptional regulator [Bacteroidota bacterium]
MKERPVTDIIQINPALTTPVYKQIVQSISRNIDNGILHKDDRLPSVNQVSAEFSLARGSVFTAYNELRSSGIIDSIPGKGYFVLSTETRQKKKIFLLFSTFTPYKETLYNSLLNHLPEGCTLDIYFHHHSIRVFESLIREQSAYYNTYIIMPEVHEHTPAILSKLDHKHTFLLDVGWKEYREDYPGVYQNFEKDIFSILVDSSPMVRKYKRLFLLFPDGVRTRDIVGGFGLFSRKKVVPTEVRNSLSGITIQKGDAFIVVDDNNLVDIILLARERGW